MPPTPRPTLDAAEAAPDAAPPIPGIGRRFAKLIKRFAQTGAKSRRMSVGSTMPSAHFARGSWLLLTMSRIREGSGTKPPTVSAEAPTCAA